MSRKSTTCMNRNGEPLTEYDSENLAKDGADYANSKYNNNLIPYRCDNCNLWHLSPKKRQTLSTKCDECRDSKGNSKALYLSKNNAQKRANIIKKEQSIELYLYKCPYNNGWHLTKDRGY